MQLFAKQNFVDRMKEALHESEQNNPTKASVESVLPGVHLQFANLNNEIGRVHVGLDEIRVGINGLVEGKPTADGKCDVVL